MVWGWTVVARPHECQVSVLHALPLYHPLHCQPGRFRRTIACTEASGGASHFVCAVELVWHRHATCATTPTMPGAAHSKAEGSPLRQPGYSAGNSFWAQVAQLSAVTVFLGLL